MLLQPKHLLDLKTQHIHIKYSVFKNVNSLSFYVCFLFYTVDRTENAQNINNLLCTLSYMTEIVKQHVIPVFMFF